MAFSASVISGMAHHFEAGSAASTWILALCLAAPHILYGFIWFFPHVWRSRFRHHSVRVFDCSAWVFKVLQFTATILWIINETPGRQLRLGAVEVGQWILGLLLVAAGQALNIGIYRAIGHEGVYYGYKLGHTIPWHHGFPFNVCPHPQYVGSVLTIWGAVALLWTQAPLGLGMVAAYWTSLYILTAVQETYF